MFCFVDSKAWNNVSLHGHTVIVVTGLNLVILCTSESDRIHCCSIFIIQIEMNSIILLIDVFFLFPFSSRKLVVKPRETPKVGPV